MLTLPLFTFYADYDQDDYGDPDNSVEACSAPELFTDNNDEGAQIQMESHVVRPRVERLRGPSDSVVIPKRMKSLRKQY